MKLSGLENIDAEKRSGREPERGEMRVYVVDVVVGVLDEVGEFFALLDAFVVVETLHLETVSDRTSDCNWW